MGTDANQPGGNKTSLSAAFSRLVRRKSTLTVPPKALDDHSLISRLTQQTAGEGTSIRRSRSYQNNISLVKKLLLRKSTIEKNKNKIITFFCYNKLGKTIDNPSAAQSAVASGYVTPQEYLRPLSPVHSVQQGDSERLVNPPSVALSVLFLPNAVSRSPSPHAFSNSATSPVPIGETVAADNDDNDEPPEELFFKAVEANDVERVSILLRKATDTSAPTSTPRHLNRRPKKVSNVNIRNEQGLSALHICALHGFEIVARLLVEHGADVNLVTRHGTTALYLACQYNHIPVVLLLLDKTEAHVDFPDLNRNTPLHAAASNGHVNTVELLLEHEADATAQNNRGETPLHVAARWGYSELVRRLLASGADVNARTDVDGATPLHIASDAEVISILIDCNADINAEDDEGLSPVHRAVRQGNVDRVRMLWNRGAKCDWKDKGMRTPLHSAAYEGHLSIVRFLVETGTVDINAQVCGARLLPVNIYLP